MSTVLDRPAAGAPAAGDRQNGPVLEVRDLVVRYAGTPLGENAVDGVSLSIAPGEVLALVGESGSGKSTTADAVLRLLGPRASLAATVLRVAGQDVLGASEKQLVAMRGRDVGYVPQDPGQSLDPTRTIGQQVIEMLRMHTDLSGPDLAARTAEVLAEAGLPEPETRLRQYPFELSGGMKQRVLIGMAVSSRPRLLIADEPTSALDVTVQRRILDQLALVTRTRGTAILFITHDLGVARERADRIAVMHRGRIVEEGSAEAVIAAPIHAYTRRLIDSAPSLSLHRRRVSAAARAPAEPESAAPILELSSLVKDFSVPDGAGGRRRMRAVDHVNLRLRAGRTFALVGESGSGKSTIARLLLRLSDPTAGTIRFCGEDITQLRHGRELRDLRRGSQFVHQHPGASLDPRMPVGAIIAEPLHAFRIGNAEARQRRVEELADAVALPVAALKRRPRELSGGQQQRVAIARALALEPRLVVLDEAVSALDVTVQAQILELLVGLQARLGVSYLFITHDLAVVREIAHEVGVMRRGEIVETGAVEQIFGAPQAAYTQELLAAVPGAREPRIDPVAAATHPTQRT